LGDIGEPFLYQYNLRREHTLLRQKSFHPLGGARFQSMHDV
jgi:hypothetical protein